jgi:phage-related minor tail protein
MKGFGGVGSAIGNVAKEASSLGLKLAGMAAGAAFAFYSIVKGAVEAGDQLGAAAERVGLSVDAYAQLRYAAAQADVEQEAFTSSMDKLNKNLGAMKAGGGEFIAFLEKVNPAFAKQMRATKNTEEALALLTDGFERVTDPAKRAALETAAFGKAGLGMGNWLGQGSEALRRQRADFLALSGSQEKFAKRSDELDMAMRRTDTAFKGIKVAALTGLFPALTKISNWLTEFMSKHRDGLAKWAEETGAKIMKWVEEGGLDRLKEQFMGLVGTIRSIVEGLGGLKGMAVIAGAVLGAPLIGSLATLTSAFITLGAAIGFTPLGWFLAACAGIAAAAYLIYDNWEPIKQFFADLWDTIKRVVGAIPRAILTEQGQEAFGVAPAPVARGNLGADAALAATRRAARGGDARVQVDFANLPKGVRVTADPKSTAPLDISLGYTMLGSR